MSDLPPLPVQPADAPWPTEQWPDGPPEPDVDAARLAELVDPLFAAPASAEHGENLALLAIHQGRLVLERYAEGKGTDDTFRSWSMAKSIVHALVGVLVGRGALDLQAPAPVPAWRGDGDARGTITLEHLLRMLDGLDFFEDYVPGGRRSDVLEMLYQSGKDDVAAYAAARPLAHAPGTCWSYSSGTSNIVASVIGHAVGGGRDGMLAFMRDVLFEPIGMRSAKPRFDTAGTFIGSSYCFATARDFARFGLLYLRDGVWDGRRLLPEGWVDHARTPTPASSGWYGAHWWLALDGSGRFSANGYEGQYIIADPRRDLILVRLGVSSIQQRGNVLRRLRDVAETFPTL